MPLLRLLGVGRVGFVGLAAITAYVLGFIGGTLVVMPGAC